MCVWTKHICFFNFIFFPTMPCFVWGTGPQTTNFCFCLKHREPCNKKVWALLKKKKKRRQRECLVLLIIKQMTQWNIYSNKGLRTVLNHEQLGKKPKLKPPDTTARSTSAAVLLGPLLCSSTFFSWYDYRWNPPFTEAIDNLPTKGYNSSAVKCMSEAQRNFNYRNPNHTLTADVSSN